MFLTVLSCADPVAVSNSVPEPDSATGPGLIPLDVLDTDGDVEDSVEDIEQTDTTFDGTIFPDTNPLPDTTPDVSPDIEQDTSEDTKDSEITDCGDNNKCTIDLFDDELGECCLLYTSPSPRDS